jgi:hypothetical protein
LFGVLTFCSQLCGKVLASLSGHGDDVSKPSQMVLIGIAATGPFVTIKDPKDEKGSAQERIRMEVLRENYKISKSEGGSWSLKKTFEILPSNKDPPSFADINHSHLCLIGDETSGYGSEVPFRSEVERYAAEKFGVPMLQFVFGGGPNTVATTLGFQNAPSALSCIVKGSGRFCHAIERYNELEKKMDNVDEDDKDCVDRRENGKKCVGWLLQTSMANKNMKQISNHEFSQIKSITDNKDK